MEKISIVIPFYNNESTIEETLKSVFEQTYKNFEVIIVNDGSTESSKTELENLKTKFNINILHQDNSGPSVARNLGADKASGDFLFFIDADDKIHNTYLEKAVGEFNKNKDLEIVYCKANFFDNVDAYWDLPEFKMPNFLLNNCIFICSLIKKKTFMEVGKFDTNLTFTEDWDLWIRIIKAKGISCVYRIPEVLFYYRKRQSKTSLTDNMETNNNAEKSRLYIYTKHYDFYKKHHLGLESLMHTIYENLDYKERYYNIWYKKLFYKLKKKA